MRAKFGRNPTVGSKKVPFKFISRLNKYLYNIIQYVGLHDPLTLMYLCVYEYTCIVRILIYCLSFINSNIVIICIM